MIAVRASLLAHNLSDTTQLSHDRPINDDTPRSHVRDRPSTNNRKRHNSLYEHQCICCVVSDNSYEGYCSGNSDDPDAFGVDLVPPPRQSLAPQPVLKGSTKPSRLLLWVIQTNSAWYRKATLDAHLASCRPQRITGPGSKLRPS
jgi:hypothetical protein